MVWYILVGATCAGIGCWIGFNAALAFVTKNYEVSKKGDDD